MPYCSLNSPNCHHWPGVTDTHFVYNPNPGGPPQCAHYYGEDLQQEIFRVVMATKDIFEQNLVPDFGKGLLKGKWRNHPYLGSFQHIFQQLAQRVKGVQNCKSSRIFSVIRRAWFNFKNALKNELPLANPRSHLLLQDPSLGDFEDSPLIVSETPSQLPNVLTPEEFSSVQETYQNIASGASSIVVGNSTSFRSKILNSFRRLCTTNIGRKLIQALERFPIQILQTPQDSDEGSYASLDRGIVTLNDQMQHLVFYGFPDQELVRVNEPLDRLLTHELIHLFHDKVQGDIDNYTKEVPWNRPFNFYWQSREEARTIDKTNQYAIESQCGGLDWPGRWSHMGTEGEPSLLQSLFELFFWDVRLDPATPAAASQLYILSMAATAICLFSLAWYFLR